MRISGLLVVATLLGGGCSCGGAALHDTGTDIGSDVPSADVPPPVDAGPWRPSFAPRVIYRNPEVSCSPPDLVFTPPERPTVARGEVRWVYEPLRDPAALEMFDWGVGEFQFGSTPIFGTADGGAVVNIDRERGSLMAVRPDGLLRGVLPGLTSPVRATVGHDGALLRAEGRRPVLITPSGGIPSDMETTDLAALPGGVRTSMVSPFSGITWQPDPVILADGSVIWSPTTHTLFASCLGDGRTRWIVEFDDPNVWGAGPFGFFGDGEGGLVFAAGDIYRLSNEGEVIAQRPRPAGAWLPVSYSTECGLAGSSHDPESNTWSMVYLRGEALDAERRLAVAGDPTSDCGVLARTPGEGGLDLARFDADGELVWRATPPGSYATIQLIDGSVLIIEEGNPDPPRLTIIDGSGEITLDAVLDPEQVGRALTPSAYYLTPDGVLYLASQQQFVRDPRVIAIEIGVGPASPYPAGNGLDWARTNAVWLSAR